LVLRIGPDDPCAPDCLALLDGHLADMRAQSPAEHVHALPAKALAGEGAQFFSARSQGELVAIGALKIVSAYSVCMTRALA
jgi:putative acetyltransferase